MQPAARVTSVTGNTVVIRGGQEMPVTAGMDLFVTDSLRTGPGARVGLKFRDDTEVDLDSLTQVNLSDFSFEDAGVKPSFAMHVAEGLARTATGQVVKMNPEGFKLTTPLGTAGIRGTEIWTRVAGKEVVFTVTELGAGHIVLVTTADGRQVAIAVPQSGVVITQSGAMLDIKNLTLDEVQKFIDQALPQEQFSSEGGNTSGLYVIGSEQALADVGLNVDLTSDVSYLSGEEQALFIAALDELNVAADHFFS